MFRSVIQIGMLLQRTLADIEHLERDVATWIMVHNINEELSSSRSEDNGKGYSRTLLLEIEPKIKKINLQIKALNKISTLLATKSKVTLVKRAEIHRLVKARFSTVATSDAINLNNENFNLKLTHLLRGTRQSIGSYIESLDAIKRFDGLNKISKRYSSQLKDAIDIMSMGIYDVAVFTAGRAVEDVINAYLRTLIKARKIKRIKLKDYKLDGKIGLLKREGIIGEKLFYDLSSVRVSRNDTGHPKNTSLRATDASDAIRRGQSLIFTLEKRIKQISK